MPETIYEGKAVHGFNFSSFIFSYGTCAASPFSALSIKRNDDFSLWWIAAKLKQTAFVLC